MEKEYSYEKLREDYTIEYPEYFNFAFDIVDRHAVENGNRVALHFIDEDHSEIRLTFRDIRIQSNRIANFIQGLGIERGDRVLVMLPRIPAWWLVMIALAKLGAIAVPSATTLQPKDLEYRAARAEIRMIIATPKDAAKCDTIRESLDTVKHFVSVGGDLPGWIDFWAGMAPASPVFVPIDGQHSTRINEPLLMYFTSGTTGYPKIVTHTQAYALAHRSTAELWHDLKPTDVIWTITDTGWAKIAWGALFGQWFIGATIFVHQYAQFRPERTLSFIERYGITVFCAPPTAWRMLILEDLKKHDLAELRRCTSAGEPLNPEVIEAWKRTIGLEIYEGYGQTESVILIGTFSGMAPRYGSMGKPSPLFEIAVIDNDLKPLPSGKEGDIAVRVKPLHPQGLFTGYLDDEQLNANVFRGDWYLTGDRAFVDEDGYYWFVGRSDDVIKSCGYRVGPFEVESALVEHESVVEAAVIGVPDRMKGQRIKAFVILSPDTQASPALARRLQEHVMRVTAAYKCPKEIEFVSELPKTASGKIRRIELREMEAKKHSQ